MGPESINIIKVTHREAIRNKGDGTLKSSTSIHSSKYRRGTTTGVEILVMPRSDTPELPNKLESKNQ
ncbi:hypothetical protein EAF00_000486 [Botryotinia globosa]|nr:hypothetical protein EAF00_000486 [Botryotinia globosa]